MLIADWFIDQDNRPYQLLYHRNECQIKISVRYAGKHKTTKCIFTTCRSDDTLEHSLVCEENPVKKKGDKDSDMLEYLKTLHSLRLHLVGLGVYWL